MNLTQMAALPAALVIAPEILTCAVLKTSVVMLARSRLIRSANTVKAASGNKPRKSEATIIAELIKTVIMRGIPRMLAIMKARVCSSHVIGSQ
jgi:hypothetical protein